MHIFKMNEFFRGISLPQPEIIESLEKKIPKQALSIPHILDFLKVNIYYYFSILGSNKKLFYFH